MNAKIARKWLAEGIISPEEYTNLTGEVFESESSKVETGASPPLVAPDNQEKIKNLGIDTQYRIPSPEELQRAERYATTPKSIEENLEDIRKMQDKFIRRQGGGFFEGPP